MSMLSSSDRTELADLLYPETTQTPGDLETKYPARQLPAEAKVTRFAPSPTGFVHIGGIYASLLSKMLADQSQGVFYLRIEDTDQRREVEGGTEGIITALQDFQLDPEEGYVDVGTQMGEYGPYIQSQRADIYAVYAKWLVSQGLAYPCFCSEAELEAMAAEQQAANLQKKGYYGKWARHRDLPLAEIKTLLAAGKSFVIRVRAPENPGKVIINDLIRGPLEMDANMYDMVLIKSNGLPTYHFAHVVDDHLMHTTHVTRGEEWLSTAPLHVQLFEMMNMPVPIYLHFAPIGKMEGSSIRKLSKRKDPEAAVSSYVEKGYPPVAVLEYLLNLINSNFSDWRQNNPTEPYQNFPIDPRKMGKSIALFDQKKLDDISRNVVAAMSAEEVYEAVTNWAKHYHPSFAELLTADPNYAVKIFGIEKYQDRPRKDIAMWSEVPALVWYFYDQLFETDTTHTFSVPEGIAAADARQLLEYFLANYNEKNDKETWIEKSRTISEQLGYARDVKSYKQNPTDFKGHIGNLMSVLRLALTKQLHTPDLYQVMQVMGAERVTARLTAALHTF